MCPNCVLNQVGIGAAYYGAFTICILFAIVALALFIWGKKSGEFSGDPEEAKYAVFDDKN